MAMSATTMADAIVAAMPATFDTAGVTCTFTKGFITAIATGVYNEIITKSAFSPTSVADPGTHKVTGSVI